MNHTCPVCSYQMAYPPQDYNICPCCGTEFGNHDIDKTYDELRQDWFRRGMPWFFRQPPLGWNPWAQLGNIGQVGYPYSIASWPFSITIGGVPSVPRFTTGDSVGIYALPSHKIEWRWSFASELLWSEEGSEIQWVPQSAGDERPFHFEGHTNLLQSAKSVVESTNIPAQVM